MCENELPTSRLSKVIVLLTHKPTYTHTDRKTERHAPPKLYTTPLSGLLKYCTYITAVENTLGNNIILYHEFYLMKICLVL